jgi:2-hydroxychromene-2-carboxylate isomerase
MKVIDYYFSPVSPWTYLGHSRLADLAARSGATVNAKPVDYGVIFPVSGGLPLGKRAPQRQAYRLMELARWRDHLRMPLTIQPKFFPVDGSQAAYLICGAPPGKRMAVAQDVLSAVWVREENIADPAVLSAIAGRNGISDMVPVLAAGKPAFAANTEEALSISVFGAPTYVYQGELFWGQDRIDFLERALGRIK